jgi:hypothetical protein
LWVVHTYGTHPCSDTLRLHHHTRLLQLDTPDVDARIDRRFRSEHRMTPLRPPFGHHSTVTVREWWLDALHHCRQRLNRGSGPMQSAADAGTGGTSPSGVAAVDLYVDGKRLGSDSTAPYRVVWNTRTYAVGNHVLSAAARDFAGNRGSSPSTNVTILR